MRTDNTELFDMLVFGAAFTFKTLFPLQLFGHAGVVDGGFTSAMEVKAMKRHS